MKDEKSYHNQTKEELRDIGKQMGSIRSQDDVRIKALNQKWELSEHALREELAKITDMN